MIKLRIEFLSEEDLLDMLETIRKDYQIVEKGKIKESKKEGSKYKIMYVEVVKKED